MKLWPGQLTCFSWLATVICMEYEQVDSVQSVPICRCMQRCPHRTAVCPCMSHKLRGGIDRNQHYAQHTYSSCCQLSPYARAMTDTPPVPFPLSQPTSTQPQNHQPCLAGPLTSPALPTAMPAQPQAQLCQRAGLLRGRLRRQAPAQAQPDAGQQVQIRILVAGGAHAGVHSA